MKISPSLFSAPSPGEHRDEGSESNTSKVIIWLELVI